MSEDWLTSLKKLVAKKPLVIFRFDGEEWDNLRNSRRGVNEFTIARTHSLLNKVRVPTACLLIGREFFGQSEAYFGLLKSRSAVTTLESLKGAKTLSDHGIATDLMLHTLLIRIT